VYIKKTCFAITIILVCVSFLYPQGQKVVKIPLPQKPREENIVNLNLAKKVGLTTAQKKFGEGVIGEPIIGYDLNGNIRVYIIPFGIGKRIFPTGNEILADIENARQFLPEAKKELAKVRELSLASKREEIKVEKRDNRMYMAKNTEWLEAEKRIEDIKNSCWGIGEYATVIVSARKDLVPILGFSNTLPYYFTYREITEQMAKEALNADNVLLVRFYYGSNLDQIFEYESPSEKKIWIVVFPPRIVKAGEITAEELEITEDEQEWIKQKWDEILKEVQNEE
jgi:hypothetical protein